MKPRDQWGTGDEIVHFMMTVLATTGTFVALTILLLVILATVEYFLN